MPGPDQLALMIPILAVLTGLVAVLVKHQQKMAEILHSRAPQPNSEVELLRREMAEMKALMHQQMIQVDSLLQAQNGLPRSPAPADLSQRLDG